MPHCKKSSKLAHFFLLPFSLCLVGGVVEMVQAQVIRENNAEIAQRVPDDGDIPIDTSNDLDIPISPSNRDIPIRIPSLVIPDNSQIIQSRKAEAYRLLLQGIERRRASDYNNAIQLDLKALAICQEIRYSECEVDAFNGLGRAYDSLGQYQKAIVFYQKSLLIYKQIGDYKGEAISLNSLGNSYYNLGQYQKAIDFYQNSLVIAKQIRDHGVEDDSLYNLGNSYHNLRQYQKAIDFYQQSLAIKRKIGDRKGEASSLNNLGNAYDSLSQYQKAIDLHQQSLTISNQIGDRKGEANSLNNIGNTYNSLGQHQKAIDFNQQSLAISKQIGNRKGEANSLNNLGNSYYSLGQYQKAIDFYQQSLFIRKQIVDLNGEATSLNNIGEVYRSLGQYQKAIDFYQQSLAIKKQIGDRQGGGSSLNNLGNAYSILGQYQKAIDSHYESLKIARQINDRNGEGSSLISLGLAYSGLGDEQKAIDFHQQSLAIKKEIGDREGEAASLNNLGRAYGILGQYQKMINFLQQSLSIFRQIGNRNGEATSFNSIGAVLNALNQPELAILSYKQSINVTESIRKDIRGLSKEEQKSYLDTIAKRYRNLADILLQQDRIIEALQVLDLLKVQELEDYLKNIKGSDRSAQGVRLLAPELALSNKLLAVSFDNSQNINNQLANQIQQLPKTEINKVPDYLNQIPRGTVLLYPFILGDRLEIILFAPNNLPIRRTVKISQDQLENLISDFRVGLLDPSSEDFKEPSIQLYNLLIKPIEAELVQFNAKTILYAPDGQLRYIPIAALYDGKQLLVEKYQISNIIAYTLSDFTPQPQNTPNILAGAFGGKAGDRKFGQTALPATVREVQAIANSFQNSVTLIEEQFSRKAIESKFKNHNILHLATHAEFNVGAPDQSFIIFGNGDKIRLNEITDWQIPNIDLIILSACQTGLGKLGSGVEILGFGYQVQKAGAKQAIASLWKVDDNKTSVLMTAFYAELQKGNVTATEALRRAQVSLIKSKDYNHPYYWAAFFAIGNGL
ncbi:tetratricopeptide repeat protein [Pseudanabaena galeata UHCC 0370]|uniref:Tetratricopeptide repeat protein n=1 Tax=Pseudanabaena galeata UHCC 0370 TaxID=3110310 RepID=A0ABU5TJR4_9CYAN|nr:tetratricopeptide repeat protein [Pseudanabaena galeata]MEA5478487.1 tetratricopeptide repeat protein [Pseudanabaena galeata UHCC 0370]